MIFLTESTAHMRRLLINRGASIGAYKTFVFADDERAYVLGEIVKRQKTTILASVFTDPATLFDLLALHRTLRENGSLPPTLIIPYLGYARQDHVTQEGEGAVGIMVAELIRNMNPKRICVVDAHSQAVVDALGPSAESLSALPLMANALERGAPVDVVVAPDTGAADRAIELARLLDGEQDVIFMQKSRPKPDVAVIRSMTGEVKGKHAVIIDDMIDTGGTMVEAVRLLAKEGAASIRIAATHGIFSKQAREKLSKLPVDRILVTNSLPQPRVSNIDVLDLTPLIISTLEQ